MPCPPPGVFPTQGSTRVSHISCTGSGVRYLGSPRLLSAEAQRCWMHSEIPGGHTEHPFDSGRPRRTRQECLAGLGLLRKGGALWPTWVGRAGTPPGRGTAARGREAVGGGWWGLRRALQQQEGLKMLPPAPTPEPTEPSCLSDHLILTASPSSGQTSGSWGGDRKGHHPNTNWATRGCFLPLKQQPLASLSEQVQKNTWPWARAGCSAFFSPLNPPSVVLHPRSSLPLGF